LTPQPAVENICGIQQAVTNIAWQQGCLRKSGSRLPQSKRPQYKRLVNSREVPEWVRCLAC